MIRWQSDYSLWRVDLCNRTYWGQRRTEIWLGHIYISWLWSAGRASS